MKILAYDEIYLDSAQNILGHMFDFAINEANLDGDKYAMMFAVSPISKQFAIGNPAYVAGCTGPELARKVLDSAGYQAELPEDVMYEDKTPQYWAGWALAFYQWQTSYSFMYILKAVPFSYILKMYSIYHEMDIMKFVETMDQKISSFYNETALKRFRLLAGLSQSKLADSADVPLRQIQLFEQGKRDITKTQASTIYKLSKALGCSMESLLQP
ncbi:MAG: helix-turn-helix transcriptional regulator [Butyrivibrio sp.]|nr:helix-turn-helix transcriptional regulator [Butyrivibrio sp.]